MKIGIFDGTISFGGGEIRRHTDRARFLTSAVGKTAKERMVSGEWRHYHIEPEDGVAGTVLFKGNLINRVFLMMRMPSDDSKEWTAAVELERKAKHDQWLRTELGEPPYEYTWGEVASDFDAKVVVSEIIVAYDH